MRSYRQPSGRVDRTEVLSLTSSSYSIKFGKPFNNGIATGYGYCWRIQKPIEWAGRRVGQFVDESRLPLEQQLTNFARISIG
ncbi:hypothetical protein, partial [Chamaesiphon sp. OTE_20_metabat_361]|uniref:hypothetical protein n=1 Tax=Chamaesiphon sp. OTE_20_metabat_361 TaxID=2964689 RepID=UPI00286A4546